ncbi:hypothetical protein C0993_001636 [Termitomyces sp. T159_Od127]|nr:hypothetical protein C0993_001636 [Termitomyces sp. T159_Od127]
MQRLLKSYKNEERRQEVPINRIRVLVQGVDFLSKLPYELTSREMAETLPVGGAFTRVLVDHLPSMNPSDVTIISEKERKELVKQLTAFDGIK